jgi:hypothetical protein
VQLWKTWRTSRRIRALESQVKRLRADVARLNKIEARQLLEKMKPAIIKVDRADDLSIVATLVADQPRDVLVD